MRLLVPVWCGGRGGGGLVTKGASCRTDGVMRTAGGSVHHADGPSTLLHDAKQQCSADGGAPGSCSSPQQLHALLQRSQLLLRMHLQMQRGGRKETRLGVHRRYGQALMQPQSRAASMLPACTLSPPPFYTYPPCTPTFSCCVSARRSARRCRRSIAVSCCCCTAVSWPQTAGQGGEAGDKKS